MRIPVPHCDTVSFACSPIGGFFEGSVESSMDYSESAPITTVRNWLKGDDTGSLERHELGGVRQSGRAISNLESAIDSLPI